MRFLLLDRRILLLVIACSGLSACQGFSPADDSSNLPTVSEPDADGSDDADRQQLARAEITAPVIQRLSNTARKQLQQGRAAHAAATLERALRIAPRNAGLWQQLAEVRLQQGQWHLAENMAAKSNLFAGDDRQLQALNWKLIASANRAQGRTEAAERAWTKYQSLRQN